MVEHVVVSTVQSFFMHDLVKTLSPIANQRNSPTCQKYIGVVFNSISCCVLNHAVIKRMHRTRISRAARGRYASGVDARCVLIASFVYFTAFVYKSHGYRDELAESPAKSKL